MIRGTYRTVERKGVDHRYKLARQHRDLMRQYLDELPKPISLWQRQLVASLTDLTLVIEDARDRRMAGKLVNARKLGELITKQRALMLDLLATTQAQGDDDDDS